MSRARRVAGATLAGMSLGLIGCTVFAGTASAHRAPNPECGVTTKTSKTTMIERPDNGGHGTWAVGTIVRTTTFTKVEGEDVPPAVVSELSVESTAQRHLWHYKATVVDEGVLVTKTGATLSPNEGKALTGGVNVNIKGGFTQDFTAVACWKNFTDAFGGETRKGATPKTSEWVPGLWGGNDIKTVAMNNDWSWDYWTCDKVLAKATESMSDAFANGTNEFKGDITGKPCPSTVPVIQPKPSASASSAPASQPPAAQPSLPVTGNNVPALAAVAVGVIALGGSLVYLGKRRRKTN